MNRLIPLLLLGTGALAASIVDTAQAAQWGCKFSADRSVTIDAAGARKIVIGAGAGDLNVRGQDGQTSLRATGRACASGEEILGQIQLESRREGDTLYLKTVFPELSGDWFGNRYASMDLTVIVPKDSAIALEDSSGDLRLDGVQSAVVADSSGDIDISNVAGDLQVTDSSGDLDIAKIGGNLNVRDSSGDVEIAGVQGLVEIPVDSSGDIQIERVAGSVHISHDSSGEIVIGDIKRDVSIDTDSSGDISVHDIGGNFTVTADTSGDVRHSRVTGAVQVPDNND